MNGEGGLLFDIYRDGRDIRDVRMISERPLQLVEMMRGKVPMEGLEFLGLMYRICGVAQRYAGLDGLQQANALEVPTILQRAQRLLVNLETLREHLWQVLVVWPKFLDEKTELNKDLTLLTSRSSEAERALFADKGGLTLSAQLSVDTKRLQALLLRMQGLIEKHVYGMHIGEWQQIETMEELQAWTRQSHTSAAAMLRYLMEQGWQSVGCDKDCEQLEVEALPPLSSDELIAKFASSSRKEFIQQPTWQQQCFETTSYTRQAEQPLVKTVTKAYGPGLLARMLARLVELSTLAQEFMWSCESFFGWKGEAALPAMTMRLSGRGLVEIEAARGRLIHWLELQQGVICDYAILAPTEWNFHPQGIAVQGLKNLNADNEQQLRLQAALWINAIDPCVSYEMNIH